MTTIDWTPSTNSFFRLWQRAALSARLAATRSGRRALPIRLQAGAEWVRLDVTSSREIRRAGEHHLESAMMEHIAAALRPGDVLYDVGANIGLISLILALRPEGGDCRFHAFEPEPRNFERLRANIAANELATRVIPHAVALGDHEGEVELFVRGTAGEGRHSIAAKKGSTGTIVVPMEPMSQFALRSNAFPDVVKIDVEGAEGYVLEGMGDLIATNPPREIFMEIHDKGLRDRMPGGSSLSEWLGERGYALEWEQQRRSGIHCHYRR